mgnify:CR=1 FL=1
MRNVSTGVRLIALSISDSIYLCRYFDVLFVYDFAMPNRTDPPMLRVKFDIFSIFILRSLVHGYSLSV